jgi:hypothetical protein
VPSRIEHLTQAEHNERFYHLVMALETPYYDWATVALFYAALHYIDAWFGAQAGLHPRGHQARNSLVRMTAQLREVESHYGQLFKRSIEVRYLLLPMSRAQVSSLEAAHFQPLKAFVRKGLGIS